MTLAYLWQRHMKEEGAKKKDVPRVHSCAFVVDHQARYGSAQEARLVASRLIALGMTDAGRFENRT